jgi:AcrR family transcriptional regulator
MADDSQQLEDTRERLLDAALRLFAEAGYRQTPVGEIERAAGLTPRAGGFYRHFASKEAVLVAALERYAAAFHDAGQLEALLPLGDAHAELLLIGRWTLQHLERHRPLLRILYREGDRLPAAALDALQGVMERGYGSAERWFEANLAGHDKERARVTAVAALGSLFNYAATVALFGAPPGGVEQEAFVREWADVWAGRVSQ